MDVVVIGAGAAGMMAAYAAASHQASVKLLEKNNKTGVKILMSGGTRCNLTHHTDARNCRGFWACKEILAAKFRRFSAAGGCGIF